MEKSVCHLAQLLCEFAVGSHGIPHLQAVPSQRSQFSCLKRNPSRSFYHCIEKRKKTQKETNPNMKTTDQKTPTHPKISTITSPKLLSFPFLFNAHWSWKVNIHCSSSLTPLLGKLSGDPWLQQLDTDSL